MKPAKNKFKKLQRALLTHRRTLLRSTETGCRDTLAAGALDPPQSRTTRRRQ